MEKELLIIGSGPAGLKAGEEAKKAGIDYLILERGEIAQSWRDIRQDMLMLSPCLPQRDWTSISEEFPIWKMEVNRPFCYAHEFLEYLLQFADHHNLDINTNKHVMSIKKNKEIFEVVTKQGTYKSKFVLVASGFFGNPYIPNIPGLRESPTVMHSHQFKSFKPFRNKRVVIIGSGNSAAETAIILAGYAQVYLLSRYDLKFFSETKNLCNIRGISESYLLELIDMEIIRHISNAKIIKVEGNLVHLDNITIEVQHILCATGYHADLSALGNMKLGVDKTTKFPYIKKTGESDSIENLFFAGPLAYTRTSSLLLHGFIRMVPKTIKELSNRMVGQVV
jgi:cation diffusion facilitator CzcD-associated flavoprotein CzcO